MGTNPVAVTDDPLLLESMYRQALDADSEPTFREAMAARLESRTWDVLTLAWAARLDLPLPANPDHARRAHWQLAVICSIALGLLFMLLRGSKMPLPLPEVAETQFWAGWSVLLALAVTTWLAALARQHLVHLLIACGVASLLAIGVAALHWNMTGDVAILAAIHLPFAVWALLGLGLTWGQGLRAEEAFAYIVKSLETLMTAGIYLGAYMVLLGLTVGIFHVLNVTFSESVIVSAIAWGIGAVPVVALASAWLPERTPSAQDWEQGLARTLRLLTRLMTPLALIVLTIYLAIYIPLNFVAPFEQRQVLIVYNATIVGIIMLICAAASGGTEPRHNLLRISLLALAGLTLVLNLYALGAIALRTLEYGLTPNRHVVFGWNLTTLIMLGGICLALWREPANWVRALSRNVGRLLPLQLAWALWVTLVLPLIHSA